MQRFPNQEALTEWDLSVAASVCGQETELKNISSLSCYLFLGSRGEFSYG